MEVENDNIDYKKLIGINADAEADADAHDEAVNAENTERKKTVNAKMKKRKHFAENYKGMKTAHIDFSDIDEPEDDEEYELEKDNEENEDEVVDEVIDVEIPDRRKKKKKKKKKRKSAEINIPTTQTKNDILAADTVSTAQNQEMDFLHKYDDYANDDYEKALRESNKQRHNDAVNALNERQSIGESKKIEKSHFDFTGNGNDGYVRKNQIEEAEVITENYAEESALYYRERLIREVETENLDKRNQQKLSAKYDEQRSEQKPVNVTDNNKYKDNQSYSYAKSNENVNISERDVIASKQSALNDALYYREKKISEYEQREFDKKTEQNLEHNARKKERQEISRGKSSRQTKSEQKFGHNARKQEGQTSDRLDYSRQNKYAVQQKFGESSNIEKEREYKRKRQEHYEKIEEEKAVEAARKKRNEQIAQNVYKAEKLKEKSNTVLPAHNTFSEPAPTDMIENITYTALTQQDNIDIVTENNQDITDTISAEDYYKKRIEYIVDETEDMKQGVSSAMKDLNKRQAENAQKDMVNAHFDFTDKGNDGYRGSEEQFYNEKRISEYEQKKQTEKEEQNRKKKQNRKYGGAAQQGFENGSAERKGYSRRSDNSAVRKNVSRKTEGHSSIKDISRKTESKLPKGNILRSEQKSGTVVYDDIKDWHYTVTDNRLFLHRYVGVERLLQRYGYSSIEEFNSAFGNDKIAMAELEKRLNPIVADGYSVNGVRYDDIVIEKTVWNNDKRIYEGVFANNPYLQTVNIGDRVHIQDNDTQFMFVNCSGLTNVIGGGKDFIQNNTFRNCPLMKINVKRVEDYTKSSFPVLRLDKGNSESNESSDKTEFSKIKDFDNVKFGAWSMFAAPAYAYQSYKEKVIENIENDSNSEKVSLDKKDYSEGEIWNPIELFKVNSDDKHREIPGRRKNLYNNSNSSEEVPVRRKSDSGKKRNGNI